MKKTKQKSMKNDVLMMFLFFALEGR